MANIKYYIEAKLDTNSAESNGDGKFKGLKSKYGLFVLGTIPDKTLSEYKQNLNFENSKKFKFSRSRGVLNISGSISKSSFVRGDCIPVSINIKNESNKAVIGFEVNIEENIDIRAREFHETKQNNIDKVVNTFPNELKSSEFENNYKGEVSLPLTSQPTCFGKLFKRTYQVCI